MIAFRSERLVGVLVSTLVAVATAIACGDGGASAEPTSPDGPDAARDRGALDAAPRDDSARSDASVADGADAATLPPRAASLRLWLEADRGVETDGAGLVTAWHDGARAKTLRQTDPAMRPRLVPSIRNALPVVQYDGKDDWLDSDESFPGGMEMTIILLARGAALQSLVRYQDVDATTGAQAFVVYPWEFQPPSRLDTLYFAADAGTRVGAETGLRANEWTLGVAVLGAAELKTFRNGQPVATGQVPAGSRLPPIHRFVSGCFGVERPSKPFCVQEFASAQVAAILVYDAALDDAARVAAEAYLTARWGAL